MCSSDLMVVESMAASEFVDHGGGAVADLAGPGPRPVSHLGLARGFLPEHDQGALVVMQLGQLLDEAAVAGLRATLLKRPELFVTTVAEKLLMYGIGRNVQYFDQPVVRSLMQESARNNYTFASLVLGVVKSAPFQMREVQPAKDMRAAR